ncbi:MAG: hydrogenase maturation protease [Bacteroidales bacterium]|nr:hydrogenase maturation protease [Bacteroidales bacterium]
MNSEKTIILGLGNVLLNDEGIGVRTAQILEKMKWPENIEVLDGGTGGFVLLSLFQTYKNMIIIDASLTNDPEGTIKVIEPKFAKDFPKSLSTHELGLKDMIESAHLLQKVPRLFLISVSINPQQDMDMTLSLKIEEKIPEIIHTVQSILKDILGFA